MKKVICILLIILGICFFNLRDKNKEFPDSKLGDISKTNKEDENIKEDIINFQSIKIGDSQSDIVSKLGEASRIDKSEYSFDWHVYNQYENQFAMIGIENNKVVALFSNSINSCEAGNIKINDDSINSVRERYTPLEYKKKGNTRYIINSQDQYDIIRENKKYITFFYDIYENNRVCSYQIISEDIEEDMKDMYPKGSKELQKSFELQIIDLVNSVRAQRKLQTLKYSENASRSSFKHSEDMKNKNFFEHINLNNETPFDRMKKEGIMYRGAGENIAAGQSSAIYAHEAWMNSKGHRKNILGDYKYIGVGVSFGGYYSTYYTQNFYI